MTSNDERDLKKLFEKRIGREAIKCTYMKTSTQKNEAFNRVLLKTLPKSTCSPTNFEGRVSAAILLNNKGIRASSFARTAVNHEVSDDIKNMELEFEKERATKRRCQKQYATKQKRISSIMNVYENYQRKNNEDDTNVSDSSENGNNYHYVKGIDLPV